MPAWAYKVHRCADERNNGKVIARLTQGDATDIDLAVKLARRAFEGEWSLCTRYDCQRLPLRVHDTILVHFDELARIETLDMGAPLSLPAVCAPAHATELKPHDFYHLCMTAHSLALRHARIVWATTLSDGRL